MLKQEQRLWLGEKKQDVILKDVALCSDNIQALPWQKCQCGDQCDPDPILQSLRGACN
jgi:hypothetical protein